MKYSYKSLKDLSRYYFLIQRSRIKLELKHNFIIM